LVLSSSRAYSNSYADNKLGGGVFSYFLAKGLSGAARSDPSGPIRLSELVQYVTDEVRKQTNDKQYPQSWTGSSNILGQVIVGPNPTFSKTIVVAVGNSAYSNPDWNTAFGTSDAEKVADVFRRTGAAEVYLVKDGSRADFWQGVKSAIRNADERSVFVFYYSGHSFVDDKGVFWLLPVDADLGRLFATAISAAEINRTLQDATAGMKVLFLDTGFSGGRVIADR